MATALALVPANDDKGRGYADDAADEGARRSVEQCRKDFEDYASIKTDEIDEQRKGWRYYHGNQITDEHLTALEARKQPWIMINRLTKKIDGLVGTVMRQRGDPKAFPRGPSHDADAELATQCIRAVMDGSMFPTAVESDCIRDAAVHGLGVQETYAEQGREQDADICVKRIDPTTFYYDPRSVMQDFSDARFFGVSKWVVPAEIEAKWPGYEGEDDQGDFQTAFDTDREQLWHRSPNRIRLVEHWYLSGAEWRVKYFTGTTELDDRRSPFVNDRNQTVPRFNAFAYAVDQDGVHYGLIRNLIPIQDAINQHRSKAVWIMNVRQLFAQKGALGPDIERARIEAARPDGVLEIAGPLDQVRIEKFDQEFLQQTKYYEEAIKAMESYGPNPALLGDQSAPSGRALTMLMQAGMAELGPFMASYRGWKLRTYKLIWWAVKAEWTQERIIRVADVEEQDGPRTPVELNASRGQVEGPDGQPQYLPLSQIPPGMPYQPVMLHPLARVDAEIILDDGPDTTNVMADAFDILSNLAQNRVPVPPQALIELSALPSSTKRKLQGILNQPPPPPPVPPPPPPDPVAMKKLDLEAMHSGDKIKLEHRKVAVDERRASLEEANAVHQADLNRANHDLEKLRMAHEQVGQAFEEQRQRHELALKQAEAASNQDLEHMRLQADAHKTTTEAATKQTEVVAKGVGAEIKRAADAIEAPKRLIYDDKGRITGWEVGKPAKG
jgi:hypothetical protein